MKPQNTRKLSVIAPGARRVIISANPSAGARSGRPAIEALATELRRRRFEVETLTDIQRVAERALEFLQAGQLRCVVAAGGDGTVALVANRTPPDTPVAVLPLGTENLLARYIGVSCEPGQIARVIETGDAVRLDAGMAGGRIFLLMVSCGFDADVVRRLHQERKGHIHHLSYAKPILDSVRNYQYPLLRIRELDVHDPADQHAAGRLLDEARWAFVVNMPRYAGGLRIVPDAAPCDGLLDVCTFQSGSLLSGLIYLTGVIFEQHQTWSDCHVHRVRRLRIESETEVPYQLDGDPGGVLPVEIEILPERLNLLVPEPWALSEGFTR